ncbi:3-deoxy-manno-octulosonate cytidylyltransferase [Endozoicomonas sp. 8E]|uniref:3-deoxy-manno-octulosonate cytidylyltransferase n=1 Tax=Endozoicomonas sp. 8E TaxID=3035692 RepID=UPI002938D616|nr:3-deoxy-manno-octulosonate cytidylyltransferase [Endozoicomonas sp. 8E]WOG29983.1 3-deoxy-manno-octulosonate cytidylyltransferase [Endozoicomonas sp. 8E]
MTPNTFKVVIPARFGSSRLPGKPLLDIAGKPMIQHVYERALETGVNADGNIVIATDDERILEACHQFGAHAVMTSTDHQSGTDRLAEVTDIMGWDDNTIIVNLQGDEPLMPHALISKVAQNLADNPQAGIATLSTPITSAADLFDTNIVKVVINQNRLALYFSRAAIPWDRDLYSSDKTSLSVPQPQRHLGMYAYRAATLQQLAQSPTASIEDQEALEQLRALWLGIGIHVESIPEQPGHGVDTADDLERVRAELNH